MPLFGMWQAYRKEFCPSSPIPLRMAKTLGSFGHFECNRTKFHSGRTSLSWEANKKSP